MHHLDPAATWARHVGAVPGHRLAPGVIARVDLRFDETKAELVHDQVYEALLFPITENPSADEFIAVDYDDRDLLSEAPPGAAYKLAPPRSPPGPGGPGSRATCPITCTGR